MLKSKNNVVNARVQKNFTDYSVIINSGSLVIENKWTDYSGTFFNVQQYLRSVITTQRVRFFNYTKYACYLVVGIDVNGALSVIEGTQTLFTTLESVPRPATFNIVPLVGIIAIQDGSSNLIDGIKPLNESNVIFYSGMGNVLDKNLVGPVGVDSLIAGETGIQGETGFQGLSGLTGPVGDIGITGDDGLGITGLDGPQGMTGLNWDVQVMFDVLL
jgi:hypothetical protein